MKITKEEQTGKRRRKSSLRSNYPESAIQAACESYLDMLGITYIRIPDAVYKAVFGSRNVSPQFKRLISSFLKGLPDFTILFSDGHYLCVELKTETGKQSMAQLLFERKVGRDNYVICRSIEKFISIINERRKSDF